MIAPSYRKKVSGVVSCYGRFKPNYSLRFKRGHWYLLYFAIRHGAPTLRYPIEKPYFSWDNVDKEWDLKSIASVQKALKKKQKAKPTRPAVNVKIGTDERITKFPWEQAKPRKRRSPRKSD